VTQIGSFSFARPVITALLICVALPQAYIEGLCALPIVTKVSSIVSVKCCSPKFLQSKLKQPWLAIKLVGVITGVMINSVDICQRLFFLNNFGDLQC